MKNRKWIIFAAGAVMVAGLLGSVVLYVPNSARAEQQGPLSELGIEQMLEEFNTEQPESRGVLGLTCDLQTLRSQIELFQFQNDRMPGFAADGSFQFQRFEREMLGSEHYGPYLTVMPANPFVQGPAARQVKAGPGPAPRDGSSGWWFDTRGMAFQANDDRSDPQL